MRSLESVERVLANVSLSRSISLLPSGYILIETLLRYQDGTSIEVFLNPESGQLTDLGQTTAWLLNLRVKPWLSPKRRALMSSVIACQSVKSEGGELTTAVTDDADLAGAVIRLGQACGYVANLAFTRRASLQSPFGERVEEFLSDGDFSYETQIEVHGQFSMNYIDFSVKSRTSSWIMTLATQSTSAAHAKANEIFRVWHDLRDPSHTPQKVTLFDDTSNCLREDDLKRLETFSAVVPLSERRTLSEILAA